ncbi:TetR/AcrR family transcriptional regulator [Enhygromyxa salina]|uniref:Transcriptional regulator BetI n=1 Tax=Enhygromyxa salina TaxID=215803 RepID=A0A2S9YXZ4_9BACT|nr:TetR/AcrR family transcriptional regulator [Enhygromyxa salina]PRQ09966.1 transcriptional regulator BetI [Enhygromyxa salina]
MREKRREATIERIVERAMHLLETEGFEALTIQRLAKELDYAVGALYRYFRSKDALLVALLHRVMDRMGEDMAAGLEWIDNERAQRLASAGQPADTPLTESEGLLRLIVVSNVYVGFAQGRPTEYGLISTLIGDPREFLATEAAAPIFPALVRLQLMLTAVINDAVQAGALVKGDARERGVILWSAMQGVLQLRKLGRFGVAGVELARLVPIALRTLLLGWGATRELVDELTPRAVEISSVLNKQRAARRAQELATRTNDCSTDGSEDGSLPSDPPEADESDEVNHGTT